MGITRESRGGVVVLFMLKLNRLNCGVQLHVHGRCGTDVRRSIKIVEHNIYHLSNS